MKVNLVAKIMQSAYLRVIFIKSHNERLLFSCNAQKIIISRGFNLIYNSW